MTNARRACFSIRSYPPSHFLVISCVGNNSKTREVERRFFACERLLQRQKRKGFLHRIVTGDEKWIHYGNPKRRKSWGLPSHASTSSVRPNIHAAKVMLCIWWDQVGVICYELLKPNKTITGERYHWRKTATI